jgi:hypothetical protein
MKRSSTPNKSEKEYQDKVRDLGCVACYLLSGEWGTPAAIHHVKGSRRTESNPEPHKEVLGLCPSHHQGHPPKKPGGYVHGRLHDFEEMFGSQKSLIARTREYL